ncbi:MAG: MgtC/SapB family protein [Ktedonobacterales bacterium]
MLALPFESVALRLFVALALGALIGAERERRDRSSPSHSAGVRTLALVSLGSALVMIVSAYGFLQFSGKAGVQVQPAQIAAQVISGIGFLGAGVILLRRDTVRGLTTAATIWLVAGIGLTCGLGFFWEATLATALALVLLTIIRPIERWLFPRRSPQLFQIGIERGASALDILESIRGILAHSDVLLEGLTIHPGRHGEIIRLRCRTTEKADLMQVIVELRALPHVRVVRADFQSTRAASPTVQS